MLQEEYSAVLLTFNKLPLISPLRSFFLSIFEWPLKTTGFAVTESPILAASTCMHMRICVHVGTPTH